MLYKRTVFHARLVRPTVIAFEWVLLVSGFEMVIGMGLGLGIGLD